jgi:hypothetical protein
MSLITFHRILIGAAIVFCFGFAAWALVLWWVSRETNSLVMGVVFVVLGALCSVYLSRLKSFVGYEDKPRR